MSRASHRPGSGARDRSDRLQPWTAALLTALVHLLLLLLVLWAPPITVAPPQDGAAGGAIQVTFIDDTQGAPPPAREPAVRKAPARRPAKAAPPAERIQTTRVAQADNPVPPEAADRADNANPRVVELAAPPEEPVSPPSGAPARPVQRPRGWGLPPGMLPNNPDPVAAGPARGRAGRNHGNDTPSSGTSMEVGGYQVYYDLLDETRLRAWRDQGMTELFLPLPGTRRYMVCPLDIALRRDSGECRLVEPDSPELEAIGDARDVIVMQRVYRLGEVLWRGPGAYR